MVHFKIQYVAHTADRDIPIVKKLWVPEDKRVYIKRVLPSDREVISDFDFRNLASLEGTSGSGYYDTLYEYAIVGDDLYVTIAARMDEDTSLPSPAYQEKSVTAPATLFLATGEAEGNENPTEIPRWLPTLTLSEKKQLAIEAIYIWRAQKEEWLINVQKYIDLHPDLAAHIGYWLRSADCVLKIFFQSDTDPLIVRAMALEAAKGPATIDDPLVLFRNIKNVIAQFPSGPDFAAIWVQTRDLSSPSDVTRKTILEVLQTRGTAEDETYLLPAQYDSTDTSWLVVD
ncbi:hypothetical protein F4Y93_06030 [Candidatus Poribacteria bacterium]|nr:hypothetical protein [Candidatus Poribacteria bacterium]